MKRHFKLKKAFTMLLISYIAILFVPAIITVNLYKKSYELTYKRCVENSLNELEQGEILFEKHISLLDVKSMQLELEPGLRWILKMDNRNLTGPDIITIMNFHKQLKVLLSDPDTYSNYSILMHNGIVFNSQTVVMGLEFYYTYNRNYSDLNAEEWIEKSFHINRRSILPMQSIRIQKVPVNSLTYTYPIINSISNVKTDGSIQFMILKETLENWFRPLITGQQGKVYIVDGQGTCLAVLQEGNTVTEYPDLENRIGNQGSYHSNIDGEKHLIVYKYSDKSDFTFVAAIPDRVAMSDATQMRRMSTVMIAVCLCLEICLGFYFTWKYTTPIHNMVKNIQSFFRTNSGLMVREIQAVGQRKKEELTVNEYEYIENSFSHLIQSNQSMESSLRERKLKERNNFIKCLFEGLYYNDEVVFREGLLTGIQLNYNWYSVASFASGEMTEQIMETLKYIRLPNVLLMYMTEGKYISVLIGTAEDNQENVIGTVKEIGMAIADSFHQTAPIGLGKIYSNVSNITYSYMQSCYSATAASDKRTDGILLYTDISQDLNTLYYPTELETKLINSTKHSEIKQIEGIFRVLYKENIEKRHLSQSMEKVLISNIAATLLKIYNDVMMDEEVNSIMEMVFRHHELSYALRILLELFVHVGQRLSSNRNDKEQIYANELRKYIEDSYNNPQLCVTMAAERFALSESYFSQFFKEMIGEAFSSYLEKVRISKAKYLILNCDYDIETITAMVGYNNSGTFRRAFKRVTGISPSTWKETE